MRVLITGSRSWSDRDAIREALAAVWHPASVLVTGGATGADTLCADCWTHWGGQVETHPPDWARHGRAAGPIRNQHMVNLGAHVCLAFIRDGSPGATHCATAAHRAGIPTHVHYAQKEH